jgi:hypothetical protein
VAAAFQRLGANPRTKLLSALVAVGVWLYVQSEQVVTEKVRAEIVYRLPESLVPVQPPPASLTLTVEGSRNAVRRMASAPMSLTVDLASLAAGEHSVDLSEYPLQGILPTARIVDRAPAAIAVELDTLTTRVLPVKAVTNGAPGAGYGVQAVHVDPDRVEISGPKKVIDGLDGLATASIDVEGLTSDRTLDVRLDPPRGVDCAVREVHVWLEVAAEAEQAVFASVPVLLRQPGWRASVDTVRVVLSGPPSTLAAIGNEDLNAVVHLPDEPTQARYTIAWGPMEGPRLQILTPGVEDVDVLEVEPPSLEVSR